MLNPKQHLQTFEMWAHVSAQFLQSVGTCAVNPPIYRIFARRDRRSACNVLTFLNSQAFCSPHYPLYSIMDVDATPTRSDLVFSFRHIDSNFGSRETFIDLGM